MAQTLATHLLKEARSRREFVLAHWELVFEAARRGQKLPWQVQQTDLKGCGSYIAAALSYRQLIAQAQQEDEENNRNAISERDRSDRASVLESLAEQEAEQLPLGKGEEFLAVVHGGALPLGHFVDQWLGQGTYTGRTEAEHRLALTKLHDWLASINQTVLVQAVTRRVAGAFVASLQEKGSLARKTINKHVSSLSSYWRWLVSRGYAEMNPWSGQGLSTIPEHRRGQQQQKERPFTDDELKMLIATET
ncbi:phage integrase N-terminal SAM-like domain-containing protein [Roseomonas sp. ACRSG]|nr:phage integrase N-terminal SAM-like domain-containing protein [Roseomonas sp. ACRSG]